ncbi:MAG: Nif3-like dinuclear metal center hexameric protein [Eubacteriales bacterium]|nr:Nif3-like dinuclear metal center hexameric protein [Eubacteriales bacterium]
MGVKLFEIESFLEKLAPKSLCEDWDNAGLLAGSHGNDICRVLVCLDVTSEIVREAIEKKIDLIISHHPVIFEKLSSIAEDNFKGRLLSQLIRNEISVYCMHTNLDAASQGVNRILADALQLRNIEYISRNGQTKEYYAGRIGYVSKPLSMADFISKVKTGLNVGTVRFVGNMNCTVEKVAVFSGAFEQEVLSVLNVKPDVIVTGDLKYHSALDLSESGFNVIDAGHYYTEIILVPKVVNWIKDKFPELDVFPTEHNHDVFTYC